jgi:hypothetical protein
MAARGLVRVSLAGVWVVACGGDVRGDRFDSLGTDGSITIDPSTDPTADSASTSSADTTAGETAEPECTADGDCDAGFVCDDGQCTAGCNEQQPCAEPLACCGTCIDVTSDVENCGGCDMPCTPAANALAECVDAECVPSGCVDGFTDCDGSAANGCETEGDCECEPGAVQECYSGDIATMGVGPCTAGVETCNEFGTAWGPCEGEVTPELTDICANSIDDNCDGAVDEDPDADGDGWTQCGGDCCDAPGRACANPELVNPGAFEVPDNRVDDDCDATADNPLPACDAGLASNSADPLQYAQAMDLCQFTDEMPADPTERVWGVIEGQFSLASGAGNPAAQSRSLRDGFGNNVMNRFGERLAVLSTGRAADNAGDVNPGFASFQVGQSMGTSSTFPADWYAANGNAVPNAPGCVDPIDTSAQNPVMLRLRVRVPTNANSFSVDMYFFSAEYPEYVCTAFNDFFVTLVDSTEPTNPADGNIAIYDDGVNTWPVGVNILSAANGLFTTCTDGTISDCGTPENYTGCTSNVELLGTGFDLPGQVTYACDYGGEAGGGTGWLSMAGNVTPGETMEIRFAIWDTSDQLFDSLVLLDNWQWSVQASEPGVRPG